MPAPAQLRQQTLVLAMLINFGGLIACAPKDPAISPASATSQPASSPSDMASYPVVGGWSQAEPLADEVQEAARFAVQAYAVFHRSRTLYKDVLEAQSQVVAGTNFSLKLQVRHENSPRTAQATVWRQLNGQYQLSDWRWLD